MFIWIWGLVVTICSLAVTYSCYLIAIKLVDTIRGAGKKAADKLQEDVKEKSDSNPEYSRS